MKDEEWREIIMTKQKLLLDMPRNGGFVYKQGNKEKAIRIATE